uniref:SWIM-type domain-containing protein n=1 Tax=Streptomyces sp. NBC_01393 TaxID=2903851 RepID=A0AAU3HTE4_9ACTN
MRLRLPEERPAEPPTGYKIAHPVLSQDGTRAGFTGVSLGGALPYGVVDEARCVYGRRHRAPHRRCDCGFHCVHESAVAEAMLCTAEHRAAVLLEVSVLGAYIRFERGFRYARQRVRSVDVGPCGCGAVAAALADAGWGRPGWRALTAACAGCVRGRTSLSLASFARLAGEGLRVRAACGPVAGVEGPEGATAGLEGATAGPGSATTGLGVAELVAEAALLQARLDWFQSQLGQLHDRGTQG